MKAKINAEDINLGVAITVVLIVLIWLTSIPAFGHGPKGHGANEFTHLQAVRKGLMLYDKLIEKGKLNESWEVGLADIKVYSRTKKEKKEVVVQFRRTDGEPQSVYIFFNGNGEYSGSNFSGE